MKGKRHLKQLMTVLLTACSLRSGLADTLTAMSKNIQRDGFLLEWKTENARGLGNTGSRSQVTWDAAATPEGVGGYFCFSYGDSCGGWTFRLYPRAGRLNTFYEIGKDTTRPEGKYHSVALENIDGRPTAIVEWLLPWTMIPVDRTLQYEIGIVAIDGCGAVKKPAALAGIRSRRVIPRGGVLSPHVLVQLVVIVILFGLYLNLRARAKRYG